jgi:hypothetical protein
VGITRVRIKLRGVHADRARDVLKVAILPLATTGATVEVDMQIAADSDSGIPAETLDLTVAEGLRQLGIAFEIETGRGTARSLDRSIARTRARYLPVVSGFVACRAQRRSNRRLPG